MMNGEIWWADLGVPFGSEPGYRRPVVVISDDAFNKSRIQTVIAASITTNLDLAEVPGNVFISCRESGLPKDAVINVSQISTLDKRRLQEKAGILSHEAALDMRYGLKLVFGID